MESSTARPVGLHVRLQSKLFDVITVAQDMKLSVAQSFLINEQGSYVSYSSRAIKEFVQAKKDLNFLYFVHAAYWSSLTDVKSKEFLSLCKETEIALNLESKGIVIHVGATKTKLGKLDQAKYVAEGINSLFQQVPDIDILLENSPHAGRNFGGDITDFGYLTGMIEQSHRVKYCIDTAHAFVYGYNLVNEQEQKQFLLLIEETFPKDSIALLHLNDILHDCGSRIDKHGIPGTGQLREKVLKKIMNNTLFSNVPIILELPGTCSLDESLTVVQQVNSWEE
jgi:apurinic endonuclease APN1